MLKAFVALLQTIYVEKPFTKFCVQDIIALGITYFDRMEERK